MLAEKELLEIKGGGADWFAIGIAGTIVTFFIGVIDGYLRPLKCNK